MGSKINPGGFDCYANALPDEPIFVLLARDPSAPDLVRLWAARRDDEIDAGIRPVADGQMVVDAGRIAADMEAWRIDNHGRWRREAATGPDLDAGAAQGGRPRAAFPYAIGIFAGLCIAAVASIASSVM